MSDVFEVAFSFKDLAIDDHLIQIDLTYGKTILDALEKALKTERQIQKFYLDVAKNLKLFLADVSKVFERIAKQRDERKLKLKSLY